MLVDWEQVVLDLESHIENKDGNSFGERELTDLLRRLRVKHRIPEGLAERALRLYGAELTEAMRRRPAAASPEGPEEMDESALHRGDPTGPEGGSNGHRHRVPARD